jgi:hypothetical protein
MCKCSQENCNLEVFENNDKCILHCEKDDWNKLDENEIKTRQQKFNEEFLKYCSSSEDGEIKEFHFYDTFNLLKEIDNGKFFFRQCHFHGLFMFDNYLKEHCFFLGNCFFYGDIDFSRDINSEFHFVNSCQFNNNSINLSGVFSKKLSFIGSDTINEINCNSVVFKNDVVFSTLTVKNNADFQFTKFYKNCSFFQSNFYSTVNFHETNFMGNVNFLFFYSKCELDLSNAVFEGQSNFLKVNVTIANRETARIIKDSFEKKNNIIAANEFYALEMKEREKELEDDLKKGKNFFEWLVFKIHGLSSNHSQDWLLSLFWLLNITFSLFITEKSIELFGSNLVAFIPTLTISILGINIAILNNEKIRTIFLFLVTFMNFGIFKIISDKHSLDCVSEKINPFSIMTEFSELNFSTMIYKITIAYLIYQLIISIRQNTRRK